MQIRVALTLLACMTGAIPAQGSESAVRLTTPGGDLHGTLLVPAGVQGPMPVALIIAGSGPTDRNGNSPLIPGRNNSLRMVADALASAGIASVRYDKRGVAGSMGAAKSESELRFTTYVDDAVLWLGWLDSQPQFTDVTVVGHSEGSFIGILAAQRANVARLISLAGAGRSATAVLDEQLSRGLQEPLLGQAREIIRRLVAGEQVDTVPPPLFTLFRPSVQPYLRSWLTLDPAAEMAKLGIPVVVVQGSTDVQVSVADAQRLAASNPRATLEVIEGMNHVLKEVREPADQMRSYGDSTMPLHPRLVEILKRR